MKKGIERLLKAVAKRQQEINEIVELLRRGV